MQSTRFAVIDVETTGGHAAGNRITEVGIAISDGTKVLDTYHTLVNPECDIPRYITNLTGISNDTVAGAPTFAEIAEMVDKMLADAVFVAHNVNFDFAFIRMEFARLGIDFRRKKLCTARYGRSLLADQKGFSLSKLAKRFNVVNEQPHRALSDALTAAYILHELIKLDGEALINKKITRLEREVKLPLYLKPDQFHSIPNVPGIYKMYGANGKPIYIGKAKRLKQRVAQHFMQSDKARTQAFMREVSRLETLPMGTELMALLQEDVEIRKYWPKYNRAQKQPNLAYHAVKYVGRDGIWRLGIQKGKPHAAVIETFYSKRHVEVWLGDIIRTQKLNPNWCGLSVFSEEKELPDAQTHNARLHEWMKHQNVETDVLLLLQGRMADEKGIVWLKNNKVYALGFAPKNIDWGNREMLVAHTQQIVPSTTMTSLVLSHLSQQFQPELVRL